MTLFSCFPVKKSVPLEAIVDSIFFMIVISFVILLISSRYFGLVDDHIFLETTLAGKHLPLLIFKETGRFCPLTAQEFNLVSILSPTAWAYYCFNAFQLCIFLYFIDKTFRQAVTCKWLARASIIVLILTPGFVTAWFRFFVSEKGMVFAFALFLYSYNKYLQEDRILHLMLGVVFANLGIYTKETGFVLIGAFSLAHLVLTSLKEDVGNRIIVQDVALLASSCAFLGVYYVNVWASKGDVPYGTFFDVPFYINVMKNIFNYILNDPILLFVGVPLCIYRLILACNNRACIDPFYDAMLIAGFIYIAGYMFLNIYSERYLFPAYLFMIPAIIHYGEEMNRVVGRHRLAKTGFVACMVLVVFNQLPYAVHLVIHYRNFPRVFNETVADISEELRRGAEAHRSTNVFLDGLILERQMEFYLGLSRFLKYNGVDGNMYQFRVDGRFGDLQTRRGLDLAAKYGVTESVPIKGDILVVLGPESTIALDKEYLDTVLVDASLISVRKASFAIPDLSIRSLIKYIVVNVWNKSTLRSAGVILKSNAFKWPDCYVFCYSQRPTVRPAMG